MMYSYGPQHMAKQKQDDQLELTYSSYVKTQDVTLKTCRRRWMIGRSGERGSGISVLAARHDDDDDDDDDMYVKNYNAFLYLHIKDYVRLDKGFYIMLFFVFSWEHNFISTINYDSCKANFVMFILFIRHIILCNLCTKCPWCNRYRRWIWTRRHEFKSWTRLIAFHIALIPLGKVWIQLFSLQLWVNSRAD